MGIPHHVIQRVNNRQACFASHEDLAAYSHWLIEASRKYKVEVHAWVFMTNHIHLLATPTRSNALTTMFQHLGRHYVRYFNHTYQRSGTLWAGRFKSCPVQEENYLLICQRYLELNPVRANMAGDPADYRWSSYQANALGVTQTLLTHTPPIWHSEKTSMNDFASIEHYSKITSVENY